MEKGLILISDPDGHFTFVKFDTVVRHQRYFDAFMYAFPEMLVVKAVEGVVMSFPT